MRFPIVVCVCVCVCVCVYVYVCACVCVCYPLTPRPAVHQCEIPSWKFWLSRASDDSEEAVKSTQLNGPQYGHLLATLDLRLLYPAATWSPAQLLLAERVWLLSSRIYAALHSSPGIFFDLGM